MKKLATEEFIERAKKYMEFLNKLGNDKYLNKELCEMILNL